MTAFWQRRKPFSVPFSINTNMEIWKDTCNTWTAECNLTNPLPRSPRVPAWLQRPQAAHLHRFIIPHVFEVGSIPLSVIHLCGLWARLPPMPDCNVWPQIRSWGGVWEKRQSTRSALMAMLIPIPLSSKNNKVVENLSQECRSKTARR